ncbi:hypothetical protein DR950_00375 [Kitasatospora xanthocidica]|uniref:Uncharacterized protein n=1 Tax=Kitasatospora xanthocidica TaxID=83382 RepID=A0A372ZKR3_9ACTN|nr:hypothetical protein [Kitasatospora xanthocidica]RGD56449.1 hypothetical protein DR950_00375 [Kitasatospora xanthocidica]
MTVGARDREALRCRSADRDIALIKRATAPAASEALRQYTGIEGLPDQRVTGYPLVDPTAADQAEARATGLLTRHVLPSATLFTALVAWLVTGPGAAAGGPAPHLPCGPRRGAPAFVR